MLCGTPRSCTRNGWHCDGVKPTATIHALTASQLAGVAALFSVHRPPPASGRRLWGASSRQPRSFPILGSVSIFCRTVSSPEKGRNVGQTPHYKATMKNEARTEYRSESSSAGQRPSFTPRQADESLRTHAEAFNSLQNRRSIATPAAFSSRQPHQSPWHKDSIGNSSSSLLPCSRTAEYHLQQCELNAQQEIMWSTTSLFDEQVDFDEQVE